MFNPSAAEPDWEWVEIHNDTGAPVDLDGWVFSDDDDTLVASNVAAVTVNQGEAAVLYNADDVDASAFGTAWGGGIKLIAVSSFPTLANGGEPIALWESIADYTGDAANQANAVTKVVFSPDSNGWPASTNGVSVYLTDVASDPDVGSNWALSVSGTDGAVTSSAGGGYPGGEIGSPGTVP